MRVGLILECGPEGADKKVCEYLAHQLRPDLELSSVTLDNKRNLVADCGKAAAKLLESGCERVVIIWDLHPSWREEAPCRKEDREAIFSSLKAAQIDPMKNKVFLVCIEEELEAWLIADGRAVSEVLTKFRPNHPVTIKDERHPEEVQNPKKMLTRLFREHVGRPYVDHQHAERIIKAMPDLKKLQRCATFVRFALKVADKTL